MFRTVKRSILSEQAEQPFLVPVYLCASQICFDACQLVYCESEDEAEPIGSILDRSNNSAYASPRASYRLYSVFISRSSQTCDR